VIATAPNTTPNTVITHGPAAKTVSATSLTNPRPTPRNLNVTTSFRTIHAAAKHISHADATKLATTPIPNNLPATAPFKERSFIPATSNRLIVSWSSSRRFFLPAFPAANQNFQSQRLLISRRSALIIPLPAKDNVAD
jgi:hypothetical protein